MRIGISGYAGSKSENYTIAKPMLEQAYKFLTDKGLAELGVNEITSIITGGTDGSDIIGLKLAKEYNVSPVVKKAQWEKYSDNTEANKAKYKEIISESDVFILFKNGNYYGGDGLLSELSAKAKLKILVYDYQNDDFFVTTGKKISSEIKEAKKKTDKKDYARIARSLIARKCILVDTETTGTGYEDEVVEIAFVDGVTGHVYFESRIQSTIPSSKGAIGVHGIPNEELHKYPTIEEIYPVFERFFDYPIVAYNATFDWRLLDQSLRKKGLELPVHEFVDAMKLCTEKYGKPMKLELVCEDMGIKPGNHSAAADTVALYHVLQELAKDKTHLELKNESTTSKKVQTKLS